MMDWLFGARIDLPSTLLLRYPELRDATWRHGGVALRVGGWCLGQSTVAGIALWRTICLSPSVALEPELLLHELRHVHQFEADPLFPLRYLWRSVKYGYRDNPYEADARAYAARRLATAYPAA